MLCRGVEVLLLDLIETVKLNYLRNNSRQIIFFQKYQDVFDYKYQQKMQEQNNTYGVSQLSQTITQVILEHFEGHSAQVICQNVKMQIIPNMITSFFQARTLNSIRSETKRRNNKKINNLPLGNSHRINCSQNNGERNLKQKKEQDNDKSLTIFNSAFLSNDADAQQIPSNSIINSQKYFHEESQNLELYPTSQINAQVQRFCSTLELSVDSPKSNKDKSYLKNYCKNEILVFFKQNKSLINKIISATLIMTLISNLQKKNCLKFIFTINNSLASQKNTLNKLQKFFNKRHKRYFMSILSQIIKKKHNQEKACLHLERILTNKVQKICYYSFQIYKNSNYIQQLIEIKEDQRSKSVKFIILFAQKQLRQIQEYSLEKIKSNVGLHNLQPKVNKWETKWIRSIALKTRSNLQTSLWRLNNLIQNQQKMQKFISAMNKKMYKPAFQLIHNHTKQSTSSHQNQFNNVLFTLEQKTQMFVQQIQLVSKIVTFNYMLEGFEAIQRADKYTQKQNQ